MERKQKEMKKRSEAERSKKSYRLKQDRESSGEEEEKEGAQTMDTERRVHEDDVVCEDEGVGGRQVESGKKGQGNWLGIPTIALLQRCTLEGNIFNVDLFCCFFGSKIF